MDSPSTLRVLGYLFLLDQKIKFKIKMQGLRNLLRHLGARPGGPAHFVVSDLREELVVYINGWPYLRRELEMPAAALHHAGTCRCRWLYGLDAARQAGG